MTTEQMLAASRAVDEAARTRRWDAWVAKGAVRDAQSTRRMTIVGSVIAAALAVLLLMVVFVW